VQAQLLLTVAEKKIQNSLLSLGDLIVQRLHHQRSAIETALADE
jgi:hypothetical protein